MKKAVLLILLWLLTQLPAQAQGPLDKIIWLPIIMANVQSCLTGNWRFIVPVQTRNEVANPSSETTGNFAAVGAATITQASTFQKYGLQSYRVQTAANGQGLQVSLGSTLTNQNYYATARVRGKLPGRWGFILKASPYIQAQLLETLGDGWFLYGVRFDGARANGSTFLRIGQIGPGSGDFYVDGIQVEAQSNYTTYCDGTQDGCAWDGAPNASTSTRSGQSRAGGNIKDLNEDYGFLVEQVIGAGAVTPTIGLDSYALLPGGELNSIKLEPRNFTLVGKFIADTEQELHDNRQALLIALSADSYPDNQPLKLRFYGARIPKEISAYYQGGLEGDLAAFYNNNFSVVGDDQWEEANKFVERAAIQFVAPDPMWYEIGESTAVLDTNDSATFRLVAARLKSTGQWSALGPPAAPGTAIYTNVRAIAEDATYAYIGGDFLNFDNQAAADYIVRYNKQTGLYSPLGTGMNGIVRDLKIDANGVLFATGVFTLASGVANTARIASWNGTTWSPLTTGLNNDGYGMVFGLDGTLHVTGAFTTAGGVAASAIASWNGTAWSALGTGLTVTAGGYTLAVGLDGTIFVGGLFTVAGGTTVNYIAAWNGSAWSVLTTGLGSFVYGLTVDRSTGILYLTGNWNTISGISIPRIASWNGVTFSALGSGMPSDGYSLSVGKDGVLYVGGDFTSAGGLTLADRYARWNGYSWAHLDIDLPGTPVGYVNLASTYVDPVIEQKYDLFLGFDTTGTGNFAGKVTASNGGSSPAFPKIVFTRSGGTTGIIETLKNETTGLELLFNYSLLNGETLTIDLNPLNKSIISSMFGPRLDAILPNSDFGIWSLQPGSQDVTSFVGVSGAPVITAYLLWRDCYKSYD